MFLIMFSSVALLPIVLFLENYQFNYTKVSAMIHGLAFAWRFRDEKGFMCWEFLCFFRFVNQSCIYTQSYLYPWTIADDKISLQI